MEAADGALKAQYSLIWGINRNPVLNTLQYANVADALFPPDIMHDVLEGYLPYLCKQLFIDLEPLGITLECINRCIESFDYGPNDDKPSQIPINAIKSRSGTNLGQNGNYINPA